MRRFLVSAAPILLMLLCSLHAKAAPTTTERWYALEMQGQRAGWTVERESRANDQITSTSESMISLRRGETLITLKLASSFTETVDGVPIAMTATTDLGGGATHDSYTFSETGVEWTSASGDTTTTRTLPLPEGRWLPPAAAARYFAKRLEAQAREITIRTIDPLNGIDPVVTTRRGFEPTTVEVLGRTVPARKCLTANDLYPDSEGIEYIDHDGNLLRNELTLGALTITVLAADKQLAQADLSPPEMMRSLFVTPDTPIIRPYSRQAATFVVRTTRGTLPDLPSSAGQRTNRLDPGSIRVTREIRRSSAPLETESRETYLESSAMLRSDDPRIVELARTAMVAAPPKGRMRAELMRRFVNRHIRTKDLSVGFASASETAQTREGDCTEHAVLLAAMLRADGTPARVVSGLIYADRFAGGKDIFGYHMWTQALVSLDQPDGTTAERWIDLDATLPDALPVTATHIALSEHALAGDSRTNALVELAPLMGRLAIDVESIE